MIPDGHDPSTFHPHPMIPTTSTSKGLRSGLGAPSWSALLLVTLLAPALQAQPPKPPKPAAGAPPPKPVEFKTDIQPSRLVAPEQMPAYLQKLETRFAILKRSNDPFGQVQDPSAPPPVVNKGPSTGKTKATFADLIKQVPVAAILAHENRFLAGGRSIAKGDRLPLKTQHNGRQTLVQVEVVEVAPNKITFRNVTTNETAVREIALMPPGMSSGTDGITTPGMVPDNKDAPLDLTPQLGP